MLRTDHIPGEDGTMGDDIRIGSLDEFTRSYVEAALFAETDAEGVPLDSNYTVEDLAPGALEAMARECAEFQAQYGAHFAGREDLAGYHFWMSRNGHGTGFWNGEWDEPLSPEDQELTHRYEVGDYLHAMAEACRERDLYVGDDGLIYYTRG
jgi:hypothetical protein